MSRGADQTSPDGRWKAVWTVKKDFHAYFESDTTYEVQVYNVATKEVLASFYRNDFENSAREQHDGVRSLQFAADSSALVVTNEDGQIETVLLPPPDNKNQA
jgi:hypothetical protein